MTSIRKFRLRSTDRSIKSAIRVFSVTPVQCSRKVHGDESRRWFKNSSIVEFPLFQEGAA